MATMQDVLASHYRRRLTLIAGMTFYAVVFSVCCSTVGLDLSSIVFGLRKLAGFIEAAFPPSGGGSFVDLAQALGETVAIAFAGTVLASALALPLGFLGARNVVGNPMLHFAIRRAFDVVRGIDILVWALLFVSAVGLGPFAGILAIAVADGAVLSKMFAEAIEAIEARQIEGVVTSGANKPTVLRFAFLPQIGPVFVSNVLYVFESNIRSATILGIVGAGGIGYQLAERMKLLQWKEVAMIILMIFGAVVITDFASGEVRRRLA